MAKKESKVETKIETKVETKVLLKKEEKSEQRTATVEELFQNCPKCSDSLLVRVQSKKGLDYLCQHCGHSEFRAWK